MNRLLRSSKFWASVIAAVALVGVKLGWHFTAEELAVIAAPLVAVIGAIAYEDGKKASK